MTEVIALFGGTFDPVHMGHLYAVSDAAKHVALNNVRLLPCHIPPHKSGPKVSAAHRLAMLELVCQDWPLFSVDTRELNRNQPSYTVETLRQYRQESPAAALIFIIGMDSLKSLDTWYHWQELLKLCHILVCQRGNCPAEFNPTIQTLLREHQTDNPARLKATTHGHILLAQTRAVRQSSTELRQTLAKGQQPNLLPPAVLTYIQQHKLYQVPNKPC